MTLATKALYLELVHVLGARWGSSSRSFTTFHVRPSTGSDIVARGPQPAALQETFARKRLLLIFSARIRDSSVERGMPRRAAAPEGPKTRPPVARKASSTIAFSCAARLLDSFNRLPSAGFVDNQLSSTVNSSVSHSIADRSITFCNSRTFPGHGYDCKRCSVRLFTRRIDFPAFRAYRSMKYLTSRGISSVRSRKGGTSRGNTFSR